MGIFGEKEGPHLAGEVYLYCCTLFGARKLRVNAREEYNNIMSISLLVPVKYLLHIWLRLV